MLKNARVRRGIVVLDEPLKRVEMALTYYRRALGRLLDELCYWSHVSGLDKGGSRERLLHTFNALYRGHVLSLTITASGGYNVRVGTQVSVSCFSLHWDGRRQSLISVTVRFAVCRKLL